MPAYQQNTCPDSAYGQSQAEYGDENWVPEFAGTVEKPSPQPQKMPEPKLPAPQRIAALIEGLPGQKEVLFGIIDFCRTPQSPLDVDERTALIRANRRSVYSPVVLRKLLEEAGALEYQEAEVAGASDDESESTEGDDDPDYLVVTLKPEGKWLATADGLSAVDAVDAYASLRELLKEDSGYCDVYLEILGSCAQSPRTQKELDVLVQNNPSTRSPRKYSGYFIDRLEANGAISWNQGWTTTKPGEAVWQENQ
ncbi:MAG: hypothetical protein LBG81_08675 [Coriobacteriaceae bacterium]|jgi:hypothetical protein|nr:hypothetical protein [Coriobacteriaceae bacterium]